MAKKKVTPVRTCSDCIHETACRAWTDGRYISAESASRCQNHETVKGSGAYLCGVLDERKRKQTNADRICVNEHELATMLHAVKWGYAPWCDYHCENEGENGCDNCILSWLQQPAEVE